jgi:NitT/TauT family transport system permease protein
MDLLSLILLLIVDTSASWLRMFVALFLSVIIGILVGIYAAVSDRAAKIILPVVDVLQTLPILAFFPFVILVVVSALPGSLGINAAVIFLIVTSMLWNIIFGAYEAIKTLPKEMIEVADIYGFGSFDKLRKIFIPASIPRVIEQTKLSWAIGLFYLVTSEIFSVGNSNYQVTYGIGVALVTLGATNIYYYLIGIAVFIAFVIATVLLFFNPLEKKFSVGQTRDVDVMGYKHAAALVSTVRKISYVQRATKLLVSGGKRIGSGGTKVATRTKWPSAKNKKTKSKDKGRLYRYIPYAFAIVIILISVYFAMQSNILQYEWEVLVALFATFVRVWVAYVVILAVVLPLCVYLLFTSRNKSRYTSTFQIIASVPATILIPLIVIGFKDMPYGPNLVAFLIFFLSGIWYVIFGITSNSGVLKSIIEVRDVFGVKGREAWKRIYIGAILPGLITGSITAIAAEWNASIVAEYFTSGGISGTGNTVITSVGVGMGKLLDLALNANNIGLLALAIINMVLMIYLINFFVWKKLYKRVSEYYK